MERLICSLKIVSILIVATWSHLLYADYSFSARWNSLNEREVVVNCDFETPRKCLLTCMNYYECIVPESICYNCIGNDLFIVNFYKNLGLSVNTTGERLRDRELTDLLRTQDFITLKANSIYNIISDYDSKSMKKKFLNLCPEMKAGVDPVVFVKVDRNGKPFDLAFVLCDKEVYEMAMDNVNYSSTEEAIDNTLF